MRPRITRNQKTQNWTKRRTRNQSRSWTICENKHLEFIADSSHNQWKITPNDGRNHSNADVSQLKTLHRRRQLLPISQSIDIELNDGEISLSENFLFLLNIVVDYRIRCYKFTEYIYIYIYIYIYYITELSLFVCETWHIIYRWT